VQTFPRGVAVTSHIDQAYAVAAIAIEEKMMTLIIGYLWIGNFGDGMSNAYEAMGDAAGETMDKQGKPLNIDCLEDLRQFRSVTLSAAENPVILRWALPTVKALVQRLLQSSH
jgi:hypothetical protein